MKNEISPKYATQTIDPGFNQSFHLNGASENSDAETKKYWLKQNIKINTK